MRILTGEPARRALLLPLRRAVRATNASLGPHGRAILYESSPGGVAIARDGLTIAREMADLEGARSIAPRILKETLFAADRDLGDGMARLAAILGAIVEEGSKLVGSGHSPQHLAAALMHLGNETAARLADQCLPLPDLTALARAVTDDVGVAEAVASAVTGAGADGVVDVKEYPGDAIVLETGRGFSFDGVLPSEHLGPTAPATSLELDDVFVLAANEIVSEFGRLAPILEGFVSKKKSLAIVARDITGSALEMLVRNRRELGLHIVALKPTDVAARAGLVIEDLAIATGATLIAAELGRNLDSLRPGMLGKAKRLRFSRGRALFIDPAGDETAIAERRATIAAEAERARYLAYDREHALRRAARLAGNWVEVGVGGRGRSVTQARLVEAKAAVHALQAALRSGVIAGGGSAFVREAAGLRNTTGAARHAAVCLARGLESLTANIAGNAGLEPTYFLAALRNSRSPATGFDARQGGICDVVTRGIADPLSISAGLLGRAVSAAATLLTVEAMICR
jgi:chaperonin GroEL (HSP60 family)